MQKKNEDTFFTAEIDFSIYRNIVEEEKEFYEISEYIITNYKKEDYDIDINMSFTKIELRDLLPEFINMLNDKEPFNDNNVDINYITNYVVSKSQYGITNLGAYWQILIELAMILPVKYLKSGIFNDVQFSKLNSIINETDEYNFNVTFNDIKLYKPFIFPFNEVNHDVYIFQDKLPTVQGQISYKGYIYSQHGIIEPKEFMGILIRIKNVAIGYVDRSLLNYPSGTYQLFRNWIFGEIYIDEGLEEAMNINRNQFKITHPNYVEFRMKFHQILNEIIFKNILNNFYKKARIERAKDREIKNREILNNISDIVLGSSYRLKWESLNTKDIIKIDKNKKEVIINPSSSILSKIPIKEQYLLEKIMFLFEISLNESKGDIIKLRKIYLDYLEKWIRT